MTSEALRKSDGDISSVGSINPVELEELAVNEEKMNQASNATLTTLGTRESMGGFDSDSEESLEMKKKLKKAGYGPKDFDAEASISSWHFDLGPLNDEDPMPAYDKLTNALADNCTNSVASMNDDVSFISQEEADQFREASQALATITQRAVDLSPAKHSKRKIPRAPQFPVLCSPKKEKLVAEKQETRRMAQKGVEKRRAAREARKGKAPIPPSPKKEKLEQEKREQRRKAQKEVEKRRAAREARLEKARKRIARKQEQERLKEKERKRKEKEARMSPQARRERAYSWYMRCGMPPRKELKKRVHGVKGISEKDIDLLPWNFSHTMVNAHKMQRYAARAKV